MSDSVKLVTDLVVNAWAAQNQRVSKFFEQYEESAYNNEVAPGRNRAVYLLGHLVAVNDGMLPLLGLGNRLFPQLDEAFIKNADKVVISIPSVKELKGMWEVLNQALTEQFSKVKPEQWLSKHTAVSEEDFVKDPKRNKLNVLISRTNHQSYHLGQLILIKA